MEADLRSSYLFNTSLARADEADAILLVGVNPRTEAPLLNARLRRAAVGAGAPVAVVGPKADLTYPSQHLGADAAVLKALAKGKHDFAAVLAKAKKPLVIVGSSVLARPDREALLAALGELSEAAKLQSRDGGWNGYSVLHAAAGRVAAATWWRFREEGCRKSHSQKRTVGRKKASREEGESAPVRRWPCAAGSPAAHSAAACV